jgi:hypothetical protein
MDDFYHRHWKLQDAFNQTCFTDRLWAKHDKACGGEFLPYRVRVGYFPHLRDDLEKHSCAIVVIMLYGASPAWRPGREWNLHRGHSPW